jgi:methylated-DNA-[protein]-cysteine S-methyltransferase
MKGFALYTSPVGEIRVEYEDGVVTALKKAEQTADHGIENELIRQVFAQLDEYFRGERQTFDFPYKLHGTAFQKKVWAALCQIPYGETRSYKEIAEAIGHPKAYRAVGLANNRNPIVIAVPCHRVIGANGSLVGYGGGLDMKQALLQLETKHKKT